MSISNDNILDINEKVNVLFNNYLGFTSTDETKPYYDEQETYNNYVIGDEILVDVIPSNPIFINRGVFNLDGSANFNIYSKEHKNIKFENLITDISSENPNFTNNSVQKHHDSTGQDIALKFTRLKLTRLSGLNTRSETVAAFNAVYNDASGNKINLLEDTIQFNYNKTSNSAPYQWSILYKNGSSLVDVSPAQGSYIFDVKSGIITFFDWHDSAFSSDMKYNGSINLVDISNNLYITFVKYIGRKGITNLQEKLDTDVINANFIGISNATITLLNNQTTCDGISGSGIQITRDNCKSLLYYSSGDKWTVGTSNFQANTFIGDLSGNSITSNCVKGTRQQGSITVKKNNLISDLSLNGGNIIYPNNYYISRQALYGTEFLIKANINYICSWEANQRIQFYLQKSDNNTNFNNIYQTTYLGPKNAGGPFQNIINIESFDDDLTIGNTYYYRIGYKLENNSYNPYGIIGSDYIDVSANNLIMIHEYSN